MSGHAKMMATRGEQRRRGGDQGPGRRQGEGAEVAVEEGTAGEAEAGALEETEEVTEAEAETGGRLIIHPLLLRSEEEAQSEDQTGDTGLGADLLTEDVIDDIKLMEYCIMFCF